MAARAQADVMRFGKLATGSRIKQGWPGLRLTAGVGQLFHRVYHDSKQWFETACIAEYLLPSPVRD